MKYKISIEKDSEYQKVEQVIDNAFRVSEEEPNEVQLVRELRGRDEFVPSLSLVAKNEYDEVVGHCMMTKVMIEGKKKTESLALAPISVRRSDQNKGVGSKLMNESIERAKEEGFESVIALGHEHYYPRFGFDYASNWNIYPSFEGVPDQNYFVLELIEGGLEGVSGIVHYSYPFYEENSF